MQETQSFSLFAESAKPPETLSKKGFAELIGVTPGRVSQLIASGLPLEPNGRINVTRGRAWVAENVDPNRRRASVDASQALLPPISPRAAREISEAEIARLKAKRMGGQLIDREATLRAIESRARAERDAWIGWVNRAAPEIARATTGDLSMIVASLDRLVREQLTMLAGVPLGDIDRG